MKLRQLCGNVLRTALLAAIATTLLCVGASAAWNGSDTLQPSDYSEDTANFTVSTAEELAWVAMQDNTFEGKTADIDLSGAEWTPIGNDGTSFQGNFNGGNHEISGLSITSGSTVGLFGTVNGSTIENVTVSGEIAIDGNAIAGGIVGQISSGSGSSTLSNCTSNVTITVSGDNGTNTVGGIVGNDDASSATTFTNCTNEGDITVQAAGSATAGGIVGKSTSDSFENCTNSGDVSATAGSSGDSCAGGVVGYLNGSSSFTNCINSGDITAESTSSAAYASGMLGSSGNSNITFTNCTNSGDVTATSELDDAYAGGVLWASSKGIVSGYTDGTFLPTQEITTQEMCMILMSYAQYNGVEVDESLSAVGVADWATNAVAWAIESDIIDENATVTDVVTRAQACQIICAALALLG